MSHVVLSKKKKILQHQYSHNTENKSNVGDFKSLHVRPKCLSGKKALWVPAHAVADVAGGAEHQEQQWPSALLPPKALFQTHPTGGKRGMVAPEPRKHKPFFQFPASLGTPRFGGSRLSTANDANHHVKRKR